MWKLENVEIRKLENVEMREMQCFWGFVANNAK